MKRSLPSFVVNLIEKIRRRPKRSVRMSRSASIVLAYIIFCVSAILVEGFVERRFSKDGALAGVRRNDWHLHVASVGISPCY